jgi:hypothetical protein
VGLLDDTWHELTARQRAANAAARAKANEPFLAEAAAAKAEAERLTAERAELAARIAERERSEAQLAADVHARIKWSEAFQRAERKARKKGKRR